MIMEKNSLHVWTVTHSHWEGFFRFRLFVPKNFIWADIFFAFHFLNKNAFHLFFLRKEFECDQMLKWIFVMSVSQYYLLNPDNMSCFFFSLASLRFTCVFSFSGCRLFCARFSGKVYFIFAIVITVVLIKVYCRINLIDMHTKSSSVDIIKQ